LPSIKKKQMHQFAVFIPDYDAILKTYSRYVVEAQQRHKKLDLKQRIDTNYLPCELYHAYDRWQPPDGIDILFLAESPPWSGEGNYFYNEDFEAPGDRMNLSTILLKKLHIELGTKEDKLMEFRRRSCFLSDSVKCVFKKRLPTDPPGARRKKIPRDLIRLSVGLTLKEEIASMNPRIIFLLGKTALRAMRYIEGFSPDLQNVTVGDHKKVGDTHIIVCAFLSERNLKRFDKGIDRAFKELELLH
jgi:hypothetical protein